jgi:hypothetical protein
MSEDPSELKPITQYRLSDHARFEMKRRQIEESTVAAVLASPGQTEALRPGRAAYQSQMVLGHPPKLYVFRVIVDTDPQPPEVVTSYRTSKVQKYWRIQT